MAVFYCQLDYEHVPYPSPAGAQSGNLANNGCGVCASSMLVENMVGISFPPETCARLAKCCGAREDTGTNLYALAPFVARYAGLKCRYTMDAEETLRFLQQGRGMAIANVRGDRPEDGYIGVFSNGGHYIVLAGAEGNTVKVWDPMYRPDSGRFDIPGRTGKVRLDGTDAYCDISVLREDCLERHFFLFEKDDRPSEPPLIALTGGLDANDEAQRVNRMYMRAVLAAGGIPVLMSLDMSPREIEHMLRRVDGVLVTGGVDVAPERYGQKPVEQVKNTSPLRDALEMELIRQCRQSKKPVLGICRGIQAMAVAMGGELYQDLPSQQPSDTPHRPSQGDWAEHTVNITPGTRLEAITGGGTYTVNSCHHQAVRRLPEGARVCATAPDGIIEGFEYGKGPLFLGVQWHPEQLHENDCRAMALFKMLIDAAACNRDART